MENQFIGASPDGLVDCACHEPGVLEIKCPWSCQNLSIKEYAGLKQSCLEIDESGEIHLKRNHQHYYQVQCQMLCSQRNWCDFFVCTSNDNFLERIYFDNVLMDVLVQKARVAYKKLIFPELKYRTLKKDIDDTKCVKDVVEKLLIDTCNNIDVDFCLDVNWEMSI